VLEENRAKHDPQPGDALTWHENAQFLIDRITGCRETMRIS